MLPVHSIWLVSVVWKRLDLSIFGGNRSSSESLWCKIFIWWRPIFSFSWNTDDGFVVILTTNNIAKYYAKCKPNSVVPFICVFFSLLSLSHYYFVPLLYFYLNKFLFVCQYFSYVYRVFETFFFLFLLISKHEIKINKKTKKEKKTQEKREKKTGATKTATNRKKKRERKKRNKM